MDRCRDRNRIRFEYLGVVLCHSLKSGVVLWRTGFAGVATNGDMVDERDFGYPSGELQVNLLYWDSVLWLIYKLWHDVAVLPVPTTRV